MNPKLANRLLERMEYPAVLGFIGIEVLDSVARQTRDVVLTDVQMPGMDGLDAALRISADAARANRPRIIATTANAMQGMRKMCLDAGMDDCMARFIRMDRLSEAVLQAPPHSSGTA